MNKEKLVKIVNNEGALTLLEKDNQILLEMFYMYKDEAELMGCEEGFYINIFNCNYIDESDMWEQNQITYNEAIELYTKYM